MYEFDEPEPELVLTTDILLPTEVTHQIPLDGTEAVAFSELIDGIDQLESYQFPPRRNDFVMPTLATDFRIHSVQQADKILYGGMYRNTFTGELEEYRGLYTRVYQPVTNELRHSHATYFFKAEMYQAGVASTAVLVDSRNAAILEARLQLEDIIFLLQAMYEHEAQQELPAMAQQDTSFVPAGFNTLMPMVTRAQLKSVFIKVLVDGRPLPAAVYINIDRFATGKPLQATGKSLLETAEYMTSLREASNTTETASTTTSQADTIPRTRELPDVAAILMDVLDELSREEQAGYDFQARHANAGPHPKIAATGFGVVFRNQHELVAQPDIPIPVLGLTAEQEAIISKMISHPAMRPKGSTLHDYDRRKGYCLFDTMSVLAGFDSDDLIECCGSPDPYTVTVEGYANKAANIVQANFIFHQLVSGKDSKSPQAKVIYITSTSFARTYDILMLAIVIKGPTGSTEKTYRHAVHISFEDQDAVSSPFEGPTVFVSYDTETYYDTEARNKTYALSTLTYRVAPIPVTMETYNPEDQKHTLQVLDTTSYKLKAAGEAETPYRWVPPRWVSVYKGDTVLPPQEIIKYVSVRYDSEGQAIKSAIDYILFLKDMLFKSGHMHIVFTGFNIAKFDNFYLLGALSEYFHTHGGHVTPFIQSNKITSIKVTSMNMRITISTFDIRCHVVGSLASCCEAWQVPTDLAKKSLDHSVVQMCYNMDPSKFNEFLEANKAVIDEYCRYDVVACMLLHVIYKTSMESIFNDAFIDRYGISLGMMSLMCKIKDLTEGSREVRLKRRAEIEAAIDKKLGYIKQDSHYHEVLAMVLAKMKLPGSLVELILLLKALQMQGFMVPTPPIATSICEQVRPLIPVRLLAQLMPELGVSAEGQDKIELPRLSQAQGQALLQLVIVRLRARLGYRLISSISSYRTIRATEDIEQYHTLASYASHIHNILVNAKGWNQVGGFRVETAQFLKTYLRIAGRSQTTFGIHEEDVYMLLDVTSLYPSAMSAPDTAYALGEPDADDPIRGQGVVAQLIDQEVQPVNGVIPPVLYKAKVKLLPPSVSVVLMDGSVHVISYEGVKPGVIYLSSHEVSALGALGFVTEPVGGHLLVGVDTTTYLRILAQAQEYNRNIASRQGNTCKVQCHYVTEFMPRKEGVMIPAIYKVHIRSQPNGVVIPARDQLGYHWDYDHNKDSYALVTTQDIESLQATGADFTVIDGVVFTRYTTDLYTEFIGIAGAEKSRQDRLRKDPSVARFKGESYSAGKREASKLALVILSGKQVMKIYTKNTEVYKVARDAISKDELNGRSQTAKLAAAAKLIHRDSHGHITMDIKDFNKYATKLSKAASIPRLIGEPVMVGEGTWLAMWDHIPQQASSNDIDGDIIYARARQYMNSIYMAVGFKNVLLTETDSVLLGLQHIPKLYGMKSIYGAPLVYANGEKAIGLLPEAPTSQGAKQFGQLELESTELLVKVITKYMKKQMKAASDYRITSLCYSQEPEHKHELVANGVHTGLRGLYMASAGKKIYVLYLRDRSNNIIKAKARFKGVTFKRDWVIESKASSQHPVMYETLSRLSARERLVYVANELESVHREDVHKLTYRDVFDLIEYKHLYLIQTRVAAADMQHMVTVQDAILKRITVAAPPEVLTEAQQFAIQRRSCMIKQFNMKRLADTISHGKSFKHKACDQCARDGEFVLDYRLLCPDHQAAEPEHKLCMTLGKSGKTFCGKPVAAGEVLCQEHKDLALSPQQQEVCSYIEKEVPCQRFVSPTALGGDIHRCVEHYNDLLAYKAIPCLMQVNGGTCGRPSCVSAVNSIVRLCRRHYELVRQRIISNHNSDGLEQSQYTLYGLVITGSADPIQAAVAAERYLRTREANQAQDCIINNKPCNQRTADMHDLYTCQAIKHARIDGSTRKVRASLCERLLDEDELGRGVMYCQKHRTRVIEDPHVMFADPATAGLTQAVATSQVLCTEEYRKAHPIKTHKGTKIALSASEAQLEGERCTAILQSGLSRGSTCGKRAIVSVGGIPRCGIHKRV